MNAIMRSFSILKRLFPSTAPEIIMLQTADPNVYISILNESSRANKQYCSQFSIKYIKYIGVKRGNYPWHATFNRIIMLEELVESGYTGWVFYLDADAFVYNFNFDIKTLIRSTRASLFAAPGGLTGHHWDINTGVFLINLGTVAGKAMVHLWFDDFMRTPDKELYAAKNWSETPCDQERLQDILRRNPGLSHAALVHVPRDLLNDQHASFVRQVLRVHGSLEERRLVIRDEVDKIVLKIPSGAARRA